MINYGKKQFIRYVMMGLAFATVTFILNSCKVNAATYNRSERITPYKDSALTTQWNNATWVSRAEDIYNLADNTNIRNTDFYIDEIDLSNNAGGYIQFGVNVIAPGIQRGGLTNQQNTYYYCEQWVSGQNVYNCSRLVPYYSYTQTGDIEYIQPTITMQVVSYQRATGNNILCSINDGENVICPIVENSKLTRIRVITNVQYAGVSANSYTYSVWLNRQIDIYDSDGKKIADAIQSQTEQQQSNHQQTMNTITDDSDQDVSSMSNATGWLPQGTIDGIINLPIALVQGITTGLQGSCTPLTLPLPFVDEDIQLPCIKTIFEQINGVNTLLNLICTPIMAIILYNYLKNLFQWIQSQIAMEGNSNWGGV